MLLRGFTEFDTHGLEVGHLQSRWEDGKES